MGQLTPCTLVRQRRAFTHAIPPAQYVKPLCARLHTVNAQLPLPTLFNSGAQMCRDDMGIQCDARLISTSYIHLLWTTNGFRTYKTPLCRQKLG